MLPRFVKATYFTVLGPMMRLNGWVYRCFRAPRRGVVRVQLGPGRRNYLRGWYNVDANLLTARVDVWADIRYGVPFRTGTVDAVYSHHVLEHLPDSRLPSILKDIHRCLNPGGVVRLGGPNGDAAARKLVEGDASWFGDFPDSRRSVGGRFANFLLCRGEHLTVLTSSYLEELLEDAGFVAIRTQVPGRDTNWPERFERDVLELEPEATPEIPHTLIVEAQKPISGDS